MQGGTAATQDVFIEHVGIPTLAAHARRPCRRCRRWACTGEVQLIVSGGIRNGADVAKAHGAGRRRRRDRHRRADRAGRQRPRLRDAEYRALGSAAGFYDDFQAGRDPAGITTQDPELAARLDPVAGGRRLANYLRVMTMEAQTIARACGKSHVHAPRARGPGRADHRGRGHGPRPARRHHLDPGAGTL